MENEILHHHTYTPKKENWNQGCCTMQSCYKIAEGFCVAVRVTLLPVPVLHPGMKIILTGLLTLKEIEEYMPGESDDVCGWKKLLRRKVDEELQMLIRQKYGGEDLYINTDPEKGEMIIRRLRKTRIDILYNVIRQNR